MSSSLHQNSYHIHFKSNNISNKESKFYKHTKVTYISSFRSNIDMSTKLKPP